MKTEPSGQCLTERFTTTGDSSELEKPVVIEFKGHSDTEVLPHLYEEEGPEFVSKLRGMFALAIYDTRSAHLVLGPRPFGIKPLFYAARTLIGWRSPARSEHFLSCPVLILVPDRQAIYDFAALFYIPAPETFYTGIRALATRRDIRGA